MAVNPKDIRRMVLKIGSALIIDQEGHVRQPWLDRLLDGVADCIKQGMEVIIVSSGSVALGRKSLKITGKTLEEKQAAAATGQVGLVAAYQQSLARHGITAGQILMTIDDTENRRRHLNARATVETLLKFGVVPVLNENDAVTTSEIRFGDNDRLAARVAQMCSADTLVLLSDIDGLYTADPRKDPEAKLIPVVKSITAEIEGMADKPPPGFSSGGMVTKIMAAKIAVNAGCRMVITRGNVDNPLRRLFHDADTPCTWFLPHQSPRSARKKWILGHVRKVAIVNIDEGALRALQAGKSLLPAGVTDLIGRFERGDVVSVQIHGREVACGLTAYSSTDARQIIGHRSSEIPEILGHSGRSELIHRADLVMIGDP